MTKKKDLITSIISFAIIAGLIATLCIMLIPILVDIIAGQDGRDVIGIIHSHGARGIPVLACLQALQVITTVVPAILIQIPAGLAYGTWAGLAICLAGSILGNMIVFVALRQFSLTLNHIFHTRRKRDAAKPRKPKKSRLPFFLNPESLNRMPHPELVAFYIYLIPGIPNGVLPHLFARTKVSFARYLVAVAAGNAPSTLVCTLVGDRLAQGDWRGAVIIIIIFAACIGVALLLRRKIITLISGGYSLSLGTGSDKQPASDAEPQSADAADSGDAADGDNGGEKPTETITGSADTTASPVPAASDTEQDAPSEEMQALGTTDITPHGWRIIKGKKQ